MFPLKVLTLLAGTDLSRLKIAKISALLGPSAILVTFLKVTWLFSSPTQNK